MIKFLLHLAEKSILPDYLIRFGIRQLLKRRLNDLNHGNVEIQQEKKETFIASMNQANIAEVPELANEQHYEVPADFYHFTLGDNKKYSSCFWDSKTETLTQAENKALKITCQRAQIKNGQNILELGCGWGSLTLYIAKNYPKSKITGVSNSHSQKTYILTEAKKRGIKNLKIITADMNTFKIKDKFDRVVSVEMIEHMRNHKKLFNQISNWLKKDGLFFMHIFVHKLHPYLFEVQAEDDWMSKFFFSGGMMPSADLPLFFQDKLNIEKQWLWSGTHYEKTANAWLENLDKNKSKVTEIFKNTYGDRNTNLWIQRWRIFFMACAELWGYDKGQEWIVAHYLFKK
jgi:cyclopropane-fatty-acyl-phospholipid synthase